MTTRYIVGDTETSGLSASPGVCEIAWAEIDEQGNVLDLQHSLIDPEVPICPAASGVHHITDDMVADAPTMEEFFTVANYDQIWLFGYSTAALRGVITASNFLRERAAKRGTDPDVEFQATFGAFCADRRLPMP